MFFILKKKLKKCLYLKKTCIFVSNKTDKHYDNYTTNKRHKQNKKKNI